MVDSNSFLYLYGRFAIPLFKYVLYKIGNREAAEEIVQEVFLGLWISLNGAPKIHNYKPWLFGAARNKVIDYYRRRGGVSFIDIGSLEKIPADPDSVAENTSEDWPDLSTLREGLDQERTRLLDLIYHFNITYEQAAEVLNVPIGTVKSRLHNLRAELKKKAHQDPSNSEPESNRNRHAKKNIPPVQYAVPGMDDVRVFSVPYGGDLTMDVYRPGGVDPGNLLPVVFFVMGYSNKDFIAHMGIKLKDLSSYPSWGKIAAASGLTAVAYGTDVPARDIHTALEFIYHNGERYGIDRERICIWACSANVTTALKALTVRNRVYSHCLRCSVIYYPVFQHFDKRTQNVPAVLKGNLRNDVPLLLVDVGKEAPELKAAAKAFAEKVHSTDMPLVHICYQEGVHGFDIYMNNSKSREIIGQTVSFMQTYLLQS